MVVVVELSLGHGFHHSVGASKAAVTKEIETSEYQGHYHANRLKYVYLLKRG